MYLFTKKRVSSAAISFVSLFVAAVVATVASPEFGTLVADGNTWLTALGVPASLLGVVFLLISEGYKAWRNSQIADDPTIMASKTAGKPEYF